MVAGDRSRHEPADEPVGDPGPPRLPTGIDLGDPAWWERPSPDGEARLMRLVTGGLPHTRPARAIRRLAVAVVAVAAAVAMLGIGYRWGDRPTPSRGTEFALAATEVQPTAAVTGRVDDTAIGTWIRLEIAALEPAAVGEYYEAWLSDGTTLVSAGTFHMRGDPAPVVLWSGVSPSDYPELLVTVQQEGTAEPSARVVLHGVLRP